MIDRTDRLWERLEKLVVQWRGIGPDDEAVRTSLNFEMTEVLMDLFCSGRDDEKNAKALEDFALVWQELDRYDPSTGSFRGFVQTRIKMRRMDAQRQDAGMHREMKEAEKDWEGSCDGMPGESDGKKKPIWVRPDSLDAPIVTSDGEDGGTLSDMVADDRSGREATQRLNVDESLCELITLILLLPQRLSGQANNPVKIKYFRMFFTDSMVLSVHTMEMEYLHKRQRDIFEAMCIPFLDFFMRDICRSLEEILASDLKLHGEMVEGRAMKRPEQPLPNDVYRQYMRVVEHIEIRSDGAISNQRASYYQFLKERLC